LAWLLQFSSKFKPEKNTRNIEFVFVLKLNPFVYAFSNRAIRRAFRQVIFRRFCCCGLRCWLCRYFCPNKSNEYNDPQSYQYQRGTSGSFATQTSQVAPRRTSSLSAEMVRILPKPGNDFEAAPDSPITPLRTGSRGGPVVSFADYLVETGSDHISIKDEKQSNQELSSTPLQKIPLNPNPD
jgi:hypothetical protein